MSDPKKAAQIRIAPPPSLAAEFAPVGYRVELLVTRTGKLSLPTDEDALAPLIDAPFGEQETKNLAGLVAMYEAAHTDHGDT